MLDLDSDSLIVTLIFESYQWGILVISKKIQLGLLLFAALPKAGDAFLEALK